MNLRVEQAMPAVFCVLALVAVSAGVFTGGLWATLGIGGGLLMFALAWVADRRLPRTSADLTLFIVFALSLMAALNGFSTRPDLSWREWLKLTSIFLPLLTLAAPAVQERAFHPRLFPVLAITSATAAALLGVELSAGGPLLYAVRGSKAALTEYNRGMSYLVLVAFPIMASLRLSRRWWFIVLYIVILLLPAGLTESRASKLALIVGLGVMLAAFAKPVLARRALSGVIVLLAAWPMTAQWLFANHYDMLARIPPSWRARMEIWDYMSYRILEHPFLGWGLGTSHALPFAEPHGALYVITKDAAPHPHNALIQLWVELGLPGLVLGILFVLMLLRRTERLDVRLQPFALGALAAAVTISMVAYNFWTDSLFAAFALTAFLFAGLQRQARTNQAFPAADK
jgi:O-antigen ligase